MTATKRHHILLPKRSGDGCPFLYLWLFPGANDSIVGYLPLSVSAPWDLQPTPGLLRTQLGYYPQSTTRFRIIDSRRSASASGKRSTEISSTAVIISRQNTMRKIPSAFFRDADAMGSLIARPGMTDAVDRVGPKAISDVRIWLKADVQTPEIEVRFTPRNGHFHGLG